MIEQNKSTQNNRKTVRRYINRPFNFIFINNRLIIFSKVFIMALGLCHSINQYRYLEQDILGRGANAKVFLGMNTLNNTKVAIKIIDLHTINNEVTKYLLQTEKKALKTIKSPNVLSAIEIIQTQNLCYFITEFCEGGTLKDYINKKMALNPYSRTIISQESALKLIMKICMGLSAMAEKGFIHRDLKTTNIMIRNKQLVIIDLGYCDNIHGNKPQLFYNVGSPSYMSPQAYMDSLYSFKSDVWAVGIIFYELLFGKTLDNGDNINNYFAKISKVGVQIPNCLSNYTINLMRSMLSLNPNQRPQALTIAQKIKQYLSYSQQQPLNGNHPKNNIISRHKYSGSFQMNEYDRNSPVRQHINNSPFILRKPVQKNHQYFAQPESIKNQQKNIIFKQIQQRLNSNLVFEKRINPNQRLIYSNNQHILTSEKNRVNHVNFKTFDQIKNQNIQFQMPQKQNQLFYPSKQKQIIQNLRESCRPISKSNIFFQYQNDINSKRQILPCRGANSQIRIQFSQPSQPKNNIKFIPGSQAIPSNINLRQTIGGFAPQQTPKENMKRAIFSSNRTPTQKEYAHNKNQFIGLGNVEVNLLGKSNMGFYKKKHSQIGIFEPNYFRSIKVKPAY